MFKLLTALISQVWRGARAGGGRARPRRAADDAGTLIEVDRLIERNECAAAERALDVLARARPDDADVAMLRARLALKRGDQVDAVRHFELAIAAQPALAAAHVELGKIHAAAGRRDDARACYEHALQLVPDSAELHNNLGVVCFDAGRLDEAQQSFRRALRLRPDFAAARNNLGRVCRERGDFAAALEMFSAVAGDFHARVNTGLVLNELGDYAQARTVLAACVREHRDNAAALCGLGEACYGLGCIDEAEAHYHAALDLDAASPAARFALGNIALLRGDFAAGWPLYEARIELAKFARNYVQDIPAWSGAPLQGRTLLVYAEQGYGDVLLFARFLPLLAAAGGSVVFHCRRELARLLANCDGVDRIVVDADRAELKADAAVALLSLGGVLRIARADLPGAIPYVRAPAQATHAWRERLGRDERVRAGLAWAGNPARAHDGNRVPGAAAYAMLGAVQGVSYDNLQPGHRAAQPDRIPLPLIDYGSELVDFADTAALIANLDIVISVDTSVAHLAGAMGKPTLLLHPGTPDWRWAIGGVDSPWYPTVTVFRRGGAQWDIALANVARALADYVAAGPVERRVLPEATQ